MPWRRTAALVLALVALTGCNDDGRTLAPAPEVPAVPQTSPTSVPLAGDLGPTIEVEGVDAALALSADATCDGVDVHPAVNLVSVPPSAAEVAIVVRDLDADGFVHWVLAGIAPTTTRIDEGVVPVGAVTAGNGFGTQGWAGPCPPAGDGPHRYEFALHVLLEPVGLAAELDGETAAGIIERASSETGRTTVVYERAG